MEVLFEVFETHFVFENFRVLEAIFYFVESNFATHSLEHC